MNYIISPWHSSIPIVPILWISQCTIPSLNNVHIITFIHFHELYNSLTTLLSNATIRPIIVTPNYHHLSYMNELHEITITLINTYFPYLVDTQYTSPSPINIRDGPGLGGTFCAILSFFRHNIHIDICLSGIVMKHFYLVLKTHKVILVLL